jgi:hypothetical protein
MYEPKWKMHGNTSHELELEAKSKWRKNFRLFFTVFVSFVYLYVQCMWRERKSCVSQSRCLWETCWTFWGESQVVRIFFSVINSLMYENLCKVRYPNMDRNFYTSTFESQKILNLQLFFFENKNNIILFRLGMFLAY